MVFGMILPGAGYLARMVTGQLGVLGNPVAGNQFL
jgi:hypothetical protein